MEKEHFKSLCSQTVHFTVSKKRRSNYYNLLEYWDL